jgi:hypothetical protein
MSDGREEREEQEKRRQLEKQEPDRWLDHPGDTAPDPWEPERGGS